MAKAEENNEKRMHAYSTIMHFIRTVFQDLKLWYG